jgi:signal transduction histidine kinase
MDAIVNSRSLQCLAWLLVLALVASCASFWWTWLQAAALPALGLALGLVLRMLRSAGRQDRTLTAPGQGVQEAPSVDRTQHMAVMGRLAERFAHEFNNQLGIISNSAHLVQRSADDARLALPAQAMLRAVDAAGRLTRRLQKLGSRPGLGPQRLDLARWLVEGREELCLLLGRRVPLDLLPANRAVPVRVDPDALDLALSGALLCVREALVDGAHARLWAGPLEAQHGLPDLVAPAEGLVQVCLQALAPWAQGQALAEEGPAAPWTQAGGCDPLDLTVARQVCEAAGGGVWVAYEPGRRLSIRLVLSRADD